MEARFQKLLPAILAGCLLVLSCYWAWQHSSLPALLAELIALWLLWLVRPGKPSKMAAVQIDTGPVIQEANNKRLGFLSHDLRSPITSILALMENERLNQHDGLASETVEQVDYYANRNLRSCDQLINLLRVESLSTLEKQPLYLPGLLDEARDQLARKAAKANISLIIKPAADDAPSLVGQSELIELALVNLIDNAINYSDAGETVTLEIVYENGWAKCHVQDQGCGIAEADLPKLFTEYGRLKNSSSLYGASLGLHLVKAIATHHGGDITVSSKQAVGSCFTLLLPVERDA